MNLRGLRFTCFCGYAVLGFLVLKELALSARWSVVVYEALRLSCTAAGVFAVSKFREGSGDLPGEISPLKKQVVVIVILCLSIMSDLTLNAYTRSLVP